MEEFRKVVEELAETKNELARVTNELNALKAKHVQRKKNNPDSEFLRLLTKVRTRMHYQESQNPELYRRVTLRVLISERVIPAEFFHKFDKAIKRLLNYQPFVTECNEHTPALDSNAVAQYVVISGETNMGKVFKNGLKATFDTRLLRMDKVIFTHDDIERYSQRGISDSDLEGLANQG